jgi:NADPH:quinone reductase-like Zn-dependent oxidoreductase
LEKGENVLIHAAASGVGTALIQLVRIHQAISTVVCSQSKIESCKK